MTKETAPDAPAPALVAGRECEGGGGFHSLPHNPDPLMQDAILNPSTTPWQSLVPAALACRKNYGMD